MEYPTEQVRKMGEMGFMGMMVSPEYGGGGMDTLSYVLAMEELSKVDNSCSVIMSVNNSLVCWGIETYGTEAQKAKYLPKLASGEWIGSFCLSEPEAGSDATHRILPDMIEIGSFIGLAAMTQSEITIKDAEIEELGIIPRIFERMGIQLEFQGNDIHIPQQERYEIQTFIDGSIMTIYDAPWPGFTPDLMSIMLVVATQAKGSVLIHQKMFESRLFFVDKLIDMGAQIILCDPHRATVIGLDRRTQLRGIEMSSPDIRAGVALLIAALSAKGTSTIHNIHQIDRGYQYIDQRLNQLGANIERV
jgi:5-enolpyruvylshikimate-3-phosphate synthase